MTATSRQDSAPCRKLHSRSWSRAAQNKRAKDASGGLSKQGDRRTVYRGRGYDHHDGNATSARVSALRQSSMPDTSALYVPDPHHCNAPGDRAHRDPIRVCARPQAERSNSIDLPQTNARDFPRAFGLDRQGIERDDPGPQYAGSDWVWNCSASAKYTSMPPPLPTPRPTAAGHLVMRTQSRHAVRGADKYV